MGGRPLSGRKEDGTAMFFPHHIYCAQSKIKLGPMGGGGVMM